MDVVKVGNVEIGGGRPAVCVPVAGHSFAEIEERTKEALDSGADLAEWRADWYDGVFDDESLSKALSFLRGNLGGMPLLVTFRTRPEGGEREIRKDAYKGFLENVISSGKADLIDVELSMGEEQLSDICRIAHEASVYVVASSHDFHATPEEDEIIRRLCAMQDCGADLLKTAVMPHDIQDVLRLLSATAQMKERYARKPLITMSMGSLGMISRLSGEVFGSALTFGSAGTASAPGQIGTRELIDVLEVIHAHFTDS